MQKFPKTYYVKFEDGGSGPEYPACYDAAEATAEMGEKITVGVYALTETIEVKGVAITNTLTRPRRKSK